MLVLGRVANKKVQSWFLHRFFDREIASTDLLPSGQVIKFPNLNFAEKFP